MNRFLLALYLCISFVFVGLSASLFPAVASVCDGHIACVPVYAEYCWTETFACALYPGEDPPTDTCTQQQCEMRANICSIPQAGGGSCTCCWNDGCYLSCGGSPTGGGGGEEEDEPPPPGATATNTPTPTPVGSGTVRARAVLVPTGTK